MGASHSNNEHSESCYHTLPVPGYELLNSHILKLEQIRSCRHDENTLLYENYCSYGPAPLLNSLP